MHNPVSFSPFRLHLPIYRLPTDDPLCTRTVVVTGVERMGFFIYDNIIHGDFKVDMSPHRFYYDIRYFDEGDVDKLECVGYMSLYDLKQHLDKKLEDFLWDDSIIVKIRSHVAKQLDENVIEIFKMQVCAKKIQRQWRRSMANQRSVIRRKRLMRKYNDLLHKVKKGKRG